MMSPLLRLTKRYLNTASSKLSTHASICALVNRAGEDCCVVMVGFARCYEKHIPSYPSPNGVRVLPFFFLFPFCSFSVLTRLAHYIAVGVEEKAPKWRDAERCKAFFDTIAEEEGFDPLVADNWYKVSMMQLWDRKVG